MGNANANKRKSNPKSSKACRGNSQDARNARDPSLTRRRDNDVSWYAQNPQLVKDAASLAFSHPLGTYLGFDPMPNYASPGIMTIAYDPSVGCGNTAIDAPTVAARYIYSYVRHANSGSANYEAPDLYMYILAWCSAACAIENAKRAYGMMFNYTTMNKYYVDSMVVAMGFNPIDIRNNMPAFRQMINLATARLNSLKIPSGIPLLERWKWTVSHIWVDDPGLKAQTYIFVPHHFLKWSGYSTETGTELVPVTFFTSQNTLFTITSYSALLDELIDPLVSEEDCGIMSGDIIKAYGSDVATLSMIDEGYLTLPEYSEEVLTQIHNTYMPVVLRGNHPHTIRQENGVIIEDLSFTAPDGDSTIQLYEKEFILDMYKDGVTPDEVMVATRLTGLYFESEEKDDTIVFHARSSGSEIPVCMYIWHRPVSDATDLYDTTILDLVSANALYTSNRASDTDPNLIRIVTYMSAFNWHPRLYLERTVDSVLVPTGVLGDMENYTVVTRDFIQNLNKVAILSECATTSHTKMG